MRHGFIGHPVMAPFLRHPGEGRDPQATGAMIAVTRFYGVERSGIWPLGPGFRRDDAVRDDPHAG